MVYFNGGGGVVGMDPMNPQGAAANFGNLSGGQIQQNLNPFAGYGQDVFNQAVDNSKGPSSGYGTVGGYPTFGSPMLDNVHGAPGDLWARMSPSDKQTFNATKSAQSGGGIGSDAHYGDQPASFDDRFSAAPAQSSFTDRWGATPTPAPQLPDLITNGGYPSFDQRWGDMPYNPYQTPSMPSAGVLNYGGLSPQDYKTFSGIVGKEAAEVWAKQQGLGGQPYGPGYFDNTFGSANTANQNSRDAIAAAWMKQNPSSGSGQMPNAVFGGQQAEDYWRDPFSFSQPGGSGYLGATGIYQDPFGGYNSSLDVGAKGLEGRPKPDYQYGGFGYDQMFDPANRFGSNSQAGG